MQGEIANFAFYNYKSECKNMYDKVGRMLLCAIFPSNWLWPDLCKVDTECSIKSCDMTNIRLQWPDWDQNGVELIVNKFCQE